MQTCPRCGKIAVIEDGYKAGAFVCWKKREGCGAKYENLSEIERLFQDKNGSDAGNLESAELPFTVEGA